jgi:hypothetical protein
MALSRVSLATHHKMNVKVVKVLIYYCTHLLK